MDELVERAVRSLGITQDLSGRGALDAVRDHLVCHGHQPFPRGQVERRLGVLSGYVDRLRALIESPGIPQRTDAWYAARENMVTGSELESAVNPSKMRAFFKGKLAGPENWNALREKPAIKWGVLYEPVATTLYEHRTRGRVHEFGLLPHGDIPGFGASPDGISDLGIMLEIKCPYSRTITGEVPVAYYAQVQAQLDTTGLDECDFLECKFEEYASTEGFLQDTHPDDPDLSRGGLEKGAVWQTDDEHEVCVGRGSAEWAASRPGAKLWRLLVYSRVRVKRDGDFMKDMRPRIERAVSQIASYRSDPSRLEVDFPAKPDRWTLKSCAFLEPAQLS